MVVLIGDSIAQGNGDDATGDGSDGLNYGGATPAAGISLYQVGSSQATYPDAAGAGTGTGDPGHMPHIGAAFLAAGFTSVTIYRWASNGASSAVTRDVHWDAAWKYLRANGVTPHVVLTCVGTNNADDVPDATLFLSDLRELDGLIEGMFPGARVGHYHPTGDNSVSRPELDTVRGHIATVVSEKSTRFEMTRDGLDISIGGTGAMADDVHPSVYGYRDQSAGLVTAYEGAS